MMGVAVTPVLPLANLFVSFFFGFWNLLSGFLIVKPQIPGELKHVFCRIITRIRSRITATEYSGWDGLGGGGGRTFLSFASRAAFISLGRVVGDVLRLWCSGCSPRLCQGLTFSSALHAGWWIWAFYLNPCQYQVCGVGGRGGRHRRAPGSGLRHGLCLPAWLLKLPLAAFLANC